MGDFLVRIGSAPISWGICEVPGWGTQLPVDRVLDEARSMGITAIEQGALGWLPTDPTEQRAKLDEYAMTLLGGFVPLVLHDPAQRDEMLGLAEQIAARMAACGGSHFITAAVGSLDDWFRPRLGSAEWAELLANLNFLEEICEDHGLVQAVHPHMDTLIETADEFRRFLDGCGVQFCFDTGHLALAGLDVASVARAHRGRIGIVHLKDLKADVAARTREREISLMAATQAGLFPSLGDGSVPLAEVVISLEAGGYRGWYVIETDVALTDGEVPPGQGPMLGIARSLEYVRSLDPDSHHARNS